MENNNNNFQNKVTTSGVTLFDENSMMLRLSYLDDSLSLMIAEPSVADNGKHSYPQENRHSFIITMDRATALYEEIIIKKVLPALESGENYDGGVFLNKRKDAIFEIRVQEGDVYIVFYKEIGEDRQPKTTYTFKFQKTQLIENYNPDGTTFEQTNVEGFFAVFCKYIEAGIYDIHNSAAHSIRKGNYYTTNSIFNYLKGIASKLGVTIEARTFNRSTSGFAAPSKPSGSDDEELPFVETTPTSSSLNDLIS